MIQIADLILRPVYMILPDGPDIRHPSAILKIPVKNKQRR